MKAFAALVCVVASLIAGAPAEAASITWNTPLNQTGSALDIVTTGTFFDSMLAQPTSKTVNGVTFNGVDAVIAGVATYENGSQITLHNGGNPNYLTSSIAPVPGGWNAAYQSMVAVNYANADDGAGGEIRLNGLTVGDEYLVQIFMPFWDANWATRFGAPGNWSPYLSAAATGGPGGAATVPHYITGTFIADTSIQSIYYNGLSGLASVFESLQVRSLEEAPEAAPVPEPASLVLLATGLAGAVRARMRRRT